MSGFKLTKDQKKALVQAALLEGACIIGGVVAFLITTKTVWIWTGVVASLGFSIPAVVRLVRGMKEHNDASR